MVLDIQNFKHKKLLKMFITDYKVVNRYGDGLLDEDSIIYPFIGKILKVKILNSVWVKYNSYSVTAEY